MSAAGGRPFACEPCAPSKPIRDLRDLTRYRKAQVRDRQREANRLHKVMQDTGIKLDSVASDLLGKSGRAMLDALVAGTTDPEVLAELARGQLRKKLPALREALEGRFSAKHALIVGQILAHMGFLDEAIERLSAAIEDRIGRAGRDRAGGRLARLCAGGARRARRRGPGRDPPQVNRTDLSAQTRQAQLLPSNTTKTSKTLNRSSGSDTLASTTGKPTMPRNLSTHELAVGLRVSEQTIRYQARRGAFPYDVTPGGHRRYDIIEVREALRSSAAKASLLAEASPFPPRGNRLDLSAPSGQLTPTAALQLQATAAYDERRLDQPAERLPNAFMDRFAVPGSARYPQQPHAVGANI